jgi:hypothetical protein
MCMSSSVSPVSWIWLLRSSMVVMWSAMGAPLMYFQV